MAIECCWPFCGADPDVCKCVFTPIDPDEAFSKKEVMPIAHATVERNPVAPPPVSEAGGDHLCALGRFSSWRDCPEHSGNMHTKHAEMNTQGETCIDSVPKPMRFAMIHGLLNPQANGTLCRYEDAIAYGDERERAARRTSEFWKANHIAGNARIAELESLLRMIATRAQTFPDFPIGWHIPEVFNAVGMQMPERPP